MHFVAVKYTAVADGIGGYGVQVSSKELYNVQCIIHLWAGRRTTCGRLVGVSFRPDQIDIQAHRVS